MAIGMGHVLIGQFCRRIKAQRMFDAMLFVVGHRGIGAIYTGGASIDQMFDIAVTAHFENIQKPADICIDISERVLKGIAHPRLSGEVHDVVGGILSKDSAQSVQIHQIKAMMGVTLVVRARVDHMCEARLFEGGVVIIIVIINTDHPIAAIE